VNPLVSIAVVSYNQKQYLRDCIESILIQDYLNTKIIIADDGSTDGTQNMLSEYEQKYPGKFILRFSEENRGITHNSNLVLSACKGKYIARFDGDDLMLPEKISKQVAFMEANPDCAICYHNIEIFDSDTKKILGFYNHRRNSHEGDVRTSIKYGTFNSQISTMFRTKYLPPIGYDETFPVSSDRMLWVDILANSRGGKIRYIDEVLARHRRHENNVTKKTAAITQADIDHLSSCNIIIYRYPNFFKEAIFYYSKRIDYLRKKDEISYFDALLFSLRLKFRFRVFVRLFVYLLSLGFYKP